MDVGPFWHVSAVRTALDGAGVLVAQEVLPGLVSVVRTDEGMHRPSDAANGVKPKLLVHERCGRLVETLPALQHDPNRPKDVMKVDCDEDGVGGDDAADCLRYLVATKSRTVAQRKLRVL
jgi:hypothetical protein